MTVGAVAATGLVACGGGGSGFGSNGTFDAGDGSTGAATDATLHNPDAPVTLGGKDGGAPACVPATCASLAANCGPVSDPTCGTLLQCGSCTAPETCGGAGVHNQCGSGGGDGGAGDGCAKQTCASQGISCGVAGDGCGGMLTCGSCAAPQTCGGATAGQCGCTGTCAAVPTCAAGTTTTLTGKVYDPAGTYGLYNALVYVPNDPSDPGLKPFAAGITCDVCGATAAGSPLVTAYTAPDGTFTLSGMPVGVSVPLVIQLGRWRRQFTVSVTASCGANSVPDKTLEMPKTHAEGDMPRIAIMTGAFDPVECVLRKIGIADSEFTDPGGGGYINFYTANDPNNVAPGLAGAGARISASTPPQDALFATTGGPNNGPVINNYDMAILECEAYAEPQSQVQEAALAAYTASGGRVFASDFQYAWLYDNPALQGAASWGINQNPNGAAQIGVIDQPPANPIGSSFQAWLQFVGVSTTGSGTVTLNPVFHNTNGVVAPTEQWLHWTSGGSNVPVQFTFNTPLGAAPANQCGRVTYSDWHAQNGIYSSGTTFPGVCPSDALTPQEAVLEFLLFNLSACVQPYTPVCTPKTCAQVGVQCGPAGDGCGNALACGTCPAGQTCGGGGPGKCGSSVTCTPETCASQSIQCGPAGDGCGNEIQCGTCPTGQICGLSTPGQCGTASK
jgi:hypothetical protein